MENKAGRQEKRKLDSSSRADRIEQALFTTYHKTIWGPFTKAIREYQLVLPGDKVCVCISGGKDSRLMALCFKHLLKRTKFPFEAKFLVRNPGYNDINLQRIKNNLKTLEIPATIVSTDIFDIANSTDKKPCYLCAKRRRGALYRIAKSWGCNKIALGHHYDDVIETTLRNRLNAGSFQTRLPKLHSDNYSGREVIRPLYLVREKDIIAFKKENKLSFIQCACRFTENCAVCDNGGGGSQRLATKLLIQDLRKTYSPSVEKNIFKAASQVNLDKVIGYKDEEGYHSFLETYNKKYKEKEEAIVKERLEELAEKKAESEHPEFVIDTTFSKKGED